MQQNQKLSIQDLQGSGNLQKSSSKPFLNKQQSLKNAKKSYGFQDSITTNQLMQTQTSSNFKQSTNVLQSSQQQQHLLQMTSQSYSDIGLQSQKGSKISPKNNAPVLAISNHKQKSNLINLKADSSLKNQPLNLNQLERQASGEQILQSFEAQRSQVLLQHSAPRTQKSNKIRIKEEKKYFDQYKRSSSRKHQTEKKAIRESKSTQNLPLESPVISDYVNSRPQTNQIPRDFIIKRRSSKIIEMVEDENKTDSFARDPAQALVTPLKNPKQERNESSEKQNSTGQRVLTDKITVEDMSPENDNLKEIKGSKQRFSEGQTPILNKAQFQNTSQSLNLNQSNSQIQFNTLSNQQWTQSSMKKRNMQSQMSNSKQGFGMTASSSAGFYNKDQILYKHSGLDGTATRFWNGIMYNPGQVINSEQNTNPLVPNFYFGPKYDEIQTSTSDKTKLQYFLKKEIEDYRNNTKATKHTRKDLMIKMLIEEVERQHLRINYLETKVKDQKAKILKLEDAIFQRSHRLLLRCASNPNHREIYYCGKSAGGLQDEEIDQSSCQMSHRSKSRLGKSMKKSNSKQQIKLKDYLKNSKGIKGSFQEGIEIQGDQDESNLLQDNKSGGNRTNRSRAKSASHSNINNRDTSQFILKSYRNEVNLQTEELIRNSERDIQTDNVQVNQSNQTQVNQQDQTTQLEADDPEIKQNKKQEELIQRQSMIFKFQDQNISKVLINKEALLQEIIGDNISQDQVMINTQALISDVEKFLLTLKQLNKLVECQQKIQLRSDRNLDFHKLLNEFQILGSQIINCESVIIFMIDVPSEELIQFTENEVIKYKWTEIFNFPIDKIKDKLIFNGEELVRSKINTLKLQGILKMKNSYPLTSTLLCRFQVLGKQGLALALDAQNFQINQGQQKMTPSFTSMDFEILNQISMSCVRMLNRERDYDLKTRLIKAQKELFKIGINLNSRSNFASLLFEAEIRLGELMNTTNVNILVIDHEEQLFFKINRKALVVNHQTSESLNNFEVEVKETLSNGGPANVEVQNEIAKRENFLVYVPFEGLAHLSVAQKKTLLILQPQSYEEYHPMIDINFEDEAKPIIIVPMINKDDDMTVQGCIQLEFKMKHYLSSNPLMGGNFGQFKLDAVTREVLEIFSNQVRISIERLNILKRYQQRRPKIGQLIDNFVKEQQKNETFIANSLHHIDDHPTAIKAHTSARQTDRFVDEIGDKQNSSTDTLVEQKHSFIKQDQERGQEAVSEEQQDL